MLEHVSVLHPSYGQINVTLYAHSTLSLFIHVLMDM